MKTLLIRPVANTFNISPPVGLGYLATSLKKNGHIVKILDCPKERMNMYRFRQYIKKNKYDLFGVQVFSCELPSVKETLRIIRQLYPDSTIVIGGAHPSGVPQEALLQLPDANFAFKGEAEIGLPLLLDYILKRKVSLNSVPGLVWRDGKSILQNGPIFIDDLDSLGFPSWELMAPSEYPQAPHEGFAKNFPVAPIVVTRGCPFSCTFCATRTVTGRRMRSRSIDHVLDEIKMLGDSYGVREIHIDDDNFTFDKDFIKRFCQALIEKEISLSWFCSSGVRLDTLDEETLELMKRAGCYTMTVAIESGVQRMLDHMKKGLKLKQIEEKVNLIKDVGFPISGLFILGYPTETKDDIKKSIDFALRLPLDRAQFANFLPLPGSEIYEVLKQNGQLDNFDFTKLHTSKVPYVPVGMTVRELKSLQREAFLRFHLRPRVFLYNLKQIKSLNQFLFLWKRILMYLFHQ